MCISIGYSPFGIDRIREIACRGRGRGSPPTTNSTR